MHHSRKGFTIVELMFSMTFVAILLLAIATVVMQMSDIYNNGVSMREVNQSGRYISDIMTRDLAESQSFSLETGLIEQNGGGRLCIGDITYAWSPGDVLNGDEGASDPLTYYNDNDHTPVRFVRIEDPGAQYCQYDEGRLVHDSIDRGDDHATELISDGQRDLVLSDFDIEEVSGAGDGSASRLYIVDATVGTNRSDYINISSDNRCEPSSEHGRTEQSYCSINTFTFAARSGSLE